MTLDAGPRHRFVARGMQLALLTEMVERARDGRGGAVLLLGEAGIGKTRLAEEAAQMARARGFQVLWGRAHPPERDVPYAPIVEALSAALDGRLGPGKAAFVDDLPDLGHLLPRLGLSPPPAPDAALARARLFDAVTRLIERLADRAPVLMVVDDLQWADEATVTLLHHLARRLEGDPVAMVATCRSTDAEVPRISRLRRSLHRLGLLTDLPLEPLDPGAAAALAAVVLGGAASRETVDRVVSRSGGIPLFVEALARELAHEGGAGVPSSVRDVLTERLERLLPDERAVLSVLAVHNAALPSVLLAEASGLPVDQVLVALERLEREAIIAVTPRGPMPAHPLLVETAIGELTEVARRRLHLRLAGALAKHLPDDLDRRAHHERGAGDLAARDGALAVLIAAGDRARDVHAHEAAARWYAAALEVVRRPGDQRSLPLVLERLGESRFRSGGIRQAIPLWEEALDRYTARHDRDAAGRVRGLLARAERDRGDLELARSHLDAGIALFVGRPHAPGLAALLRDRAALLERLDDLAALATTVATLQAVTGPGAPPRSHVDAGLTAAALFLRRRAFTAARAALDDALQTAGRADDPQLLLAVHDAAVAAALEVADLRAVRDHADRALALADLVGAPASAMRARGCLAVAGFFAGDRGVADDGVAATLGLARRLGIPRGLASALAIRAIIRAFRGELDRARADLEEAARVAASVPVDEHVAGDVAMARARLALEAGDLPTSLALLDVLTSSRGRNVPVRLALAGEVQLAVGDGGAAMRLAGELETLDGGDLFSTANAARLRGLEASARGDPGTAWTDLCAAADRFTALGVHLEAARTVVDLPLSGPRGETVTRLRDAVRILEAAGLRRAADQGRRALRSMGHRPAPPRRRADPAAPLSDRELEVARLFAEGLTTTEVAERLFISPHTATTHLRHVYARLGVRSRAALTRALLDAGLG